MDVAGWLAAFGLAAVVSVCVFGLGYQLGVQQGKRAVKAVPVIDMKCRPGAVDPLAPVKVAP